MKEVRIHDDAIEEFEDLFAEFHEVSGDLANRFRNQVREFIKLISANPLMFHAGRYRISRANLGDGFQRYYLAYIQRLDYIMIIAVGKGERRPYYFKDRLGGRGI